MKKLNSVLKTIIICVAEAILVFVSMRLGFVSGMKTGGYRFGLNLLNNVLSPEKLNQFCDSENIDLIGREALNRYLLKILDYWII